MIKLEGIIKISTDSELQVLDAFKTSQSKKELDVWCEENSVFYEIFDIRGYTVNGGEGKIKIKYLTTNSKLDGKIIFEMFKSKLDYFANTENKRKVSPLISPFWKGFEYEKHTAFEENND